MCLLNVENFKPYDPNVNYLLSALELNIPLFPIIWISMSSTATNNLKNVI